MEKAIAMTSFEDRERAEEAKFARDAELAFRIQARRNRLLGYWAAELMGLSEDETETYVTDVVKADFEEAGDDDVVRKLLDDIVSTGLAITEAEVRGALQARQLEAQRLLKGET
jgi:hypothetical protein